MSTQPVSVLSVALRCRCPRCGRGPLFEKIAKVKPACPACGLDYSGISAGGEDPSVFMTLILGFVVVGAALWFEFTYEPPIWAHILIWPVFAGGLVALLLPRLKAALIAQKYRHKAEEGRLDV